MVYVFGSAKLDRTDPGKQVLYYFILRNRCRQNTTGIDFMPFFTLQTHFRLKDGHLKHTLFLNCCESKKGSNPGSLPFVRR
jgi:hypothetical protein